MKFMSYRRPIEVVVKFWSGTTLPKETIVKMMLESGWAPLAVKRYTNAMRGIRTNTRKRESTNREPRLRITDGLVEPNPKWQENRLAYQD